MTSPRPRSPFVAGFLSALVLDVVLTVVVFDAVARSNIDGEAVLYLIESPGATLAVLGFGLLFRRGSLDVGVGLLAATAVVLFVEIGLVSWWLLTLPAGF